MEFVCEVAYVIFPLRTTYSRFTSTPPKRSRFIILLEDSKYVVELACVSARFLPLGPIVLPIRVPPGFYPIGASFWPFYAQIASIRPYFELNFLIKGGIFHRK
jgi:hypothetical protein